VNSTVLTALILLAAIWLGIEALLWSVIRWLRADFQWLITPADETPEFDAELIEKYGELSFDSDLGWVRRAGTSGREATAEGEKLFTLDENGCRTNPGFSGKQSRIAVFGDSFAFCRLVNNDETWPHHLSALTGSNVLNFGVGNYGVDQAVLRLEREISDLKCEHVVLGFVPETISRVHSYWRHYFEYGNILAFKPRFTLEDGRLVHHPSAVQQLSDFAKYTKQLEKIRKLDEFYERKFHRDMLVFPYLPKVLKRRTRSILRHLLWGRMTGSKDGGFREAFRVVMRENSRVSAKLYEEHDAKSLLTALIRRFVDTCVATDCKPALVVIPQPVDLESISQGRNDYAEFYRKLSEILPVLDMTGRFRAEPDPSSLYVDGELGPHPSSKGNKIIAEEIVANIIETPIILEAITE
jgi:hypothetical protein